MNQYVTGATIKRLREKEKLTQLELAEKLGVSDKAISKWETGRGFPDITFLEPLSVILKVSTIELLSGNEIINCNRHGNMMNSHFYVCPVCGNVSYSVGEVLVSCCGIQLPSVKPGEAEKPDENHQIEIQKVEDEIYVSINHEMSKTHFISWIAVVACDSVEIFKMYPEQNAEVRFKPRGKSKILAYCNKHGCYEIPLSYPQS